MMTKFDHPAVVLKREIIDERHLIITFRPAQKIEFVPGQYLSIVMEGMRPTPFSIASSTAQHDIEFGIGVYGESTTALRDIPIGTKVILRGPFGRFTLHDERRVCLLAGGVGITPFASMLRSLRDTGSDVDVVLLASGKQKRQILWFDELSALRPPLRAVFTLTEEQDPSLHHGRIDAAFIREHVPDFAQRTFYACGPPMFVDVMFAAFKELGVPEERMIKEAW